MIMQNIMLLQKNILKLNMSLLILILLTFAVVRVSAKSLPDVLTSNSHKTSWKAKDSTENTNGEIKLNGKQYTGTVVPLVIETMSSGTDAYFYGTIERVARIGSIIKPQIIDIEGNVVEEGTIVMQQGTKYWKDIVQGNKALLAASEQKLKTATENFERYKKLSSDGAQSVQSYEAYQEKYFDSIGECERNKGTLVFNQRMLDTRTQIAPFEGIVSKVLYIMGRASGNPQTIELTQLNPIGIKVKMTREEANKINSNTPVTLFQTRTKIKQGVFYGHSILCDDGIIFITENYPEILTNNLIDNSMPEVSDCYSIDFFNIDNTSDKTLGVPENALVEDTEGYYVLKAKDRKFLNAGKGLDPSFCVEKIYIIPGDLRRLHAGFTYIRSLKNSASLREGDVVLVDHPKRLKNGDCVNFSPARYVFMPNETAKVVIE